jgi:glycosyltransferase involved in cell wall biosynthesis
MKIGIYCEFFAGNVVAGREYVVAVIAETLPARGHDVELVHHAPELTADDFTERFALPPAAIRLRYLPMKPSATAGLPWRQRRVRRAWGGSISEPYDCFINIVHWIPVQCHAPRGILIVLFPFFRPFEMWSGRTIPGYGSSRLWVLLRHLSYRLGWQARMGSYAVKTSISHYVQRWTQRRWHLKKEVLYPPSASSLPDDGPKENLILSVGHLNGPHPTMVDKRQLEMMKAFREIEQSRVTGWSYLSLGGMGASEREQSYVNRVRAETTANSEVRVNPPYSEVADAYGKASIFWHAAGFGNNEELTPELSEHFGIATVDAMMCGCVPVVIRKGAQPEIVEHGVSGFPMGKPG